MKTISIVIPAYNEEKTIEEILKIVTKAPVSGLKKEIVVVDDGSTDGTAKKLLKYKNKKGYKIILNKKNRGKGAALKTGFDNTTGDIVIVQDADLEYNPNEYPILISPIIEGKADVVYGSRFMGSAPHRVVYYWHFVMNRLLTMLSNMFTNINLTDMETCYKVFRGEIIRKVSKKLKSDRFGFEPEVTARLAKIKDIRFFEVGISYYGRTYQEGKKINWFDGVKAVYEIIRYNLFD